MSKEVNLFEETAGGYHEAPLPEGVEQIVLGPDEANQQQIKRIIEAILFASPTPISFNKIRDVVHTVHPVKAKELRELIQELAEEYTQDGHAFALEEIAEGFVLRSRPEFSTYLDHVFRNKKIERLSHSATEVLAIIAYKQPITRPQIEEIRGVDSSGVLASLMERGLVEIVGKLEVAGRPSLYGTTKLFLEHYGLRATSDLPQMKHTA